MKEQLIVLLEKYQKLYRDIHSSSDDDQFEYGQKSMLSVVIDDLQRLLEKE